MDDNYKSRASKKKSQTNLKYYHIPEITQSTIVSNLENKYSGIKDLMKLERINN